MQFGAFQLGGEALPDRYGYVFGGRDLMEKFGNLFVEEAVIHGVENFAVHDFFELFEIDYEAGARIDFSFHRDF